ncbi:MAG: gas vesicle structural protein GvpA [Solirubrobacterales bacterium]|nr:gas vesicle structural protein GvpA [Solirubrobacterales bacterium]
MAVQRGGGGGGYAQRSGSSGLYDVLDLLLDKGLVIDVFLRVSLVGIELLTVDARIVIASVDTYLRFAEAVNRLDLGTSQGQGLPEIVEGVAGGDAAQSRTKGILEGAKESLFGSSEEDEGEGEENEQEESSSSSGSGSRSSSGSGRRTTQRSRSRSRSGSSSRGRESS